MERFELGNESRTIIEEHVERAHEPGQTGSEFSESMVRLSDVFSNVRIEEKDVDSDSVNRALQEVVVGILSEKGERRALMDQNTRSNPK